MAARHEIAEWKKPSHGGCAEVLRSPVPIHASVGHIGVEIFLAHRSTEAAMDTQPFARTVSGALYCVGAHSVFMLHLYQLQLIEILAHDPVGLAAGADTRC